MATNKKASRKKAKKTLGGRASIRLRTGDVVLRVRSRSEAGDDIVAKIKALATPKTKSKK